MAARKATAKKTPTKKTPAKKTPAKKTPAKKSAARKTPAKTPAKSAAAKNALAKGAAAKKAPARPYLRREDLGAPADAFFAQQPSERREHLEALRSLVKKAAPGARESMKWGMPYYELKGGFCALYTSKTYAALSIMAPPEKLDDPEGKLEGTGKTMRHLKVRSAADIDEASILRWVKAAVALHS
ncbi:DUF1801 domain-containing protein [Pyxidicoccus sp. 3LG]